MEKSIMENLDYNIIRKLKIKNYLELPFYLRNPLTKLTMQSHNLDSGAHGGH